MNIQHPLLVAGFLVGMNANAELLNISTVVSASGQLKGKACTIVGAGGATVNDFDGDDVDKALIVLAESVGGGSNPRIRVEDIREPATRYAENSDWRGVISYYDEIQRWKNPDAAFVQLIGRTPKNQTDAAVFANTEPGTPVCVYVWDENPSAGTHSYEISITDVSAAFNLNQDVIEDD